MIRANLLLDDGSDPRDLGGLLGLLIGAAVVVLCIVFVVIADAQIREEAETLGSSSTELHGQISELTTSAEQLRLMNTKIEDVETFIEKLDVEATVDTAVNSGLVAFAPVFADLPRRTDERRQYEERGWNDRWTIIEVGTWSLQMIDNTWSFAGSGATAEDIQELALRLHDLDGIDNEGFESLSISEEDPLSYAFEWSGTLAKEGEGDTQ